MKQIRWGRGVLVGQYMKTYRSSVQQGSSRFTRCPRLRISIPTSSLSFSLLIKTIQATHKEVRIIKMIMFKMFRTCKMRRMPILLMERFRRGKLRRRNLLFSITMTGGICKLISKVNTIHAIQSLLISKMISCCKYMKKRCSYRKLNPQSRAAREIRIKSPFPVLIPCPGSSPRKYKSH